MKMFFKGGLLSSISKEEKESKYHDLRPISQKKDGMLVRLLLSVFIIAFNTMKLLVKTKLVSCHFLYLKYDLRYSSFESVVFNYPNLSV